MTIQQFKKIVKQIKLVEAELEKEAIETGVDLMSQEYEDALIKAKQLVLEKAGFTYDEYKEIKERISSVSKAGTLDFADRTKVKLKELENRHIPTTEEIEEIAKSVIPAPINKTEIVNKIVKEKTIEKPQIIKEIVKELDKTELDKLGQDIKTLQLSHTDLFTKVEQIKMPNDYVQTSVLEPSVKEIIAPELNRILRSLQSQIYLTDHNLRNLISSEISIENLFDRTGTTITPHTAGDSLDMGTGDINTTGNYGPQGDLNLGGYGVTTINQAGGDYDTVIEADTDENFFFLDGTANGRLGLGAGTDPRGLVELGAGTTTIAPLILNSGSLLSSKVAGAFGFLTDKLYFTITTGTAEKELTLNDIALTATRVPFVNAVGRLTDDADMTFATDTLTVTKIGQTTFTAFPLTPSAAPDADYEVANKKYVDDNIGASKALSNLASVAINEALISDTDNTDALGSIAKSWSDLFLGNGSVITWTSAASTSDITLTHSADLLTIAGGDLAVPYIATGGNELLAHDVIRKTLSAAEGAANQVILTWNKAVMTKIVGLTAVTYDGSAQVFSQIAGAYYNLEIHYDGTYITVTDSTGNFDENDILTVYVVYEK